MPEGRQTVLAPTFGLAYEYWVSRRFGAGYGFELRDDWEFAIAASYLNREIDDVVAIGLVVGRRFGGAVRGR